MRYSSREFFFKKNVEFTVVFLLFYFARFFAKNVVLCNIYCAFEQKTALQIFPSLRYFLRKRLTSVYTETSAIIDAKSTKYITQISTLLSKK